MDIHIIFSTHCGKEGDSKTRNLGSNVVTSMLQPDENVDQHVLFFNNFFIRHALLEEFTAKGFRACGTVRDTITGKCPLPSRKEVEKREREAISITDQMVQYCE